MWGNGYVGMGFIEIRMEWGWMCGNGVRTDVRMEWEWICGNGIHRYKGGMGVDMWEWGSYRRKDGMGMEGTGM